MYRLIVRLEWLLGVTFVMLLGSILISRSQLFPGHLLCIIISVVLLSALFVIGAAIAPEDPSLPKSFKLTGQENAKVGVALSILLLALPLAFHDSASGSDKLYWLALGIAGLLYSGRLWWKHR